MDTDTILSIIATVGGFEAVKWIWSWIADRHFRKRVQRAEAADAELEVEKDRINWLETRLTQRDAKIDTLYAELRSEQTAHLEAIHKCHEQELRLQEALIRRCDVRGCDRRKPPGEY